MTLKNLSMENFTKHLPELLVAKYRIHYSYVVEDKYIMNHISNFFGSKNARFKLTHHYAKTIICRCYHHIYQL
jgi:CRISPR/Cas system endoribonuclease Cas6 (RAMP superfamily)